MKLHHSVHGIPRETRGLSDDAWRIECRDETVIAALADGLGASKEGRDAARRAVDMLVDYYLTRPQAWSSRRALREFASQINRLLHQESQLRHGTPELLCTLSVAAIEGNQLQGLNIGDSPVFLYRRGTLTQLTHHHSLAEEGLEHVLTHAIGLAPTLEPHCWETTVEDGDIILLCSDGISTALPPEKLGLLLKSRAGAHTIVSAARDAVAEKPDLQDDASVIVLDIVESGWRGATTGRTVEVLRSLASGQMIDSYRLVRPLQSEARVWLAENSVGVRQVLKFPPLDAFDDEVRRDGFVRELWNATRVASPDFVRAQTPAEGSLRYYTMDYIEAPTLREALKKASLVVEEAIALAQTLLRASQFLLSHDLVHGDLKPDNILMVAGDAAPRFMLLDLGSAAQIFSVTSRAGTPTYLAPERFQGTALSERTEIFAVGVILYEALTRSYPYGEIERFQNPTFEQTPKRPTRLNAAIPPWLEAIIQRAIAVNPTDRYQNFSEMVFDLDHPQEVTGYIRRGAPWLERNPLRFYKSLSLFLFFACVVLLYLMAHK
jgi:serine/threonine protein phosphatase PrpC